MRFSVLASGSSGNATVVEAGNSAVLVDCGLSVRRLQQRAAAIGFDLARLDAIVVTHEHGDHIGGVAALAKRFGIPAFMTHGTRAAAGVDGIDVVEITPHALFNIGELRLSPSPVPHDAREPCQYVIEHGSSRLGILTDLGSDTPHIQQHFADCAALVLEFNHDSALLAACEYPASVKQRIAGRLGHFNNHQATSLLKALASEHLQHVVGAHVSKRANDPAIVSRALDGALREAGVAWRIAEQDCAMTWIEV